MYLDFVAIYNEIKESQLSGRYISYADLEKPIKKLSEKFKMVCLGESVKGAPINSLIVGNGKIKVLAWSQMHGNESTTTKAVFDLLNGFLKFEQKDFIKYIFDRFTLQIIPMLNPDGAAEYIRVNAHGVDLNRDALDLKEPESRLLRKVLEDFKPDFCLNLHDQRTIFSAGNTASPARLSFLTPSQDPERSITPSRKASMRIIASIAEHMARDLPSQIGRYDDSYNPNCTGDNFQSLEIPTILFEAGHFPGDYERELSRKYVACALYSALFAIVSGVGETGYHKKYFEIPENQKLYYDLILRRASTENGIRDIAIQFHEILVNKKLMFIPYIEKIADKLEFFGHKELDCQKKRIGHVGQQPLSEKIIVNKVVLDNEILAINYDSF